MQEKGADHGLPSFLVTARFILHCGDQLLRPGKIGRPQVQPTPADAVKALVKQRGETHHPLMLGKDPIVSAHFTSVVSPEIL